MVRLVVTEIQATDDPKADRLRSAMLEALEVITRCSATSRKPSRRYVSACTARFLSNAPDLRGEQPLSGRDLRFEVGRGVRSRQRVAVSAENASSEPCNAPRAGSRTQRARVNRLASLIAPQRIRDAPSRRSV